MTSSRVSRSKDNLFFSNQKQYPERLAITSSHARLMMVASSCSQFTPIERTRPALIPSRNQLCNRSIFNSTNRGYYTYTRVRTCTHTHTHTHTQRTRVIYVYKIYFRTPIYLCHKFSRTRCRRRRPSASSHQPRNPRISACVNLHRFTLIVYACTDICVHIPAYV